MVQSNGESSGQRLVKACRYVSRCLPGQQPLTFYGPWIFPKRAISNIVEKLKKWLTVGQPIRHLLSRFANDCFAANSREIHSLATVLEEIKALAFF